MSVTAEIDPIQRIADTDDETEVRRRFSAHNSRYAGILFAVTVFVSILLVLVYSFSSRQLATKIIGAAGLGGLAAVGLALCIHWIKNERRGAGETRILRHFNDWLVVLLLSQYAAILLIASRSREGFPAWAIIYGGVLLILRLPFDRRVMTHLAMLLVAVVATETGLARASRAPLYAGGTVTHTLILLVSGYNTRRVRREIIGEWSERRAQAVDQLRMRGELQYAREVQLSMLPESPPSLPWIDLAGISIPATEVGGDYFDYFPMPDQVAIVSGDVAGHGLASGIVLSALRAGFTLLRGELSQPGMVLRRLHDVVAQATRRRMLTTATIVLIHRTGTATIANAGHPPIILRRADGTVVSIELFAPPLGVRLPIHVAERKLPFTSGDVLVIHSDGAYESRNSAGESYGLDALESFIGGIDPSTSALGIRDLILADLERFRAGAPQEDDVTLVVARLP